ncbi:hypothetical protein K3N28_13280 [Glycomyces sp. TRM65418]|uniref:hypothetical protein n=1 Tax=Glycomyces sp. TRM65418 TaxID=2867006 RepID=UPI001CE4E01B|nr:hypothetical protein [Glycomyces sp. TRM65418]MCC3764037.1 hypothetical protein [Glycomyces sp. TRM65418]QZD53728.1 hypothetical protein K3N28_13215 [Glycomyces sp. TRM65418]
MAGVHRRRGRLSKEGRRLLGGVALLAVFAPVTAYTLNAAIAHVQSCGTEVDLRVAAAPEMAAMLDDFVAAGGGAPSRGSDVCADITVEAVTGNAVTDAHVWIPETALWRDLPDTGAAQQWDVLQESTATSAVGMALPAGESTDQILPDEADVALQDPRGHAASLMWIIMFGADGHTPDGVPVMSAPEVAAANAAGGEERQPPSGMAQIGQFEYPMLLRAGLGDDEREAAQNLLRSYGSDLYTELLVQHAFGPAIPQPAPASPEVVAAALASWDAREAG